MALEGLYVKNPEAEPVVLAASFKQGTPDVAEAVGVTIEAHKELGYNPDVDKATESLTRDFGERAVLGLDGRLYLEPPAEVTTDDIIAAADGKRPFCVAETHRYPSLWVPGHKNNYTAEEQDAAAPEEPEARLAVFSVLNNDVDNILHLLGMPYDDKYKRDGEQTQLEAIAEAKEQFDANYDSFQLHTLGQRAVAMMVLMDRIRGVDHRSKDFILNTGFMRVPDLGRRKVGGASLVGRVFSRGGRFNLNESNGKANHDNGVGFGMRQKVNYYFLTPLFF